MIKGKVELENGQVMEREFDGVKDFIQSDYILWRDFKKSYDFYYDDIKIDRLESEEKESEISFVKEIKYLKDMIDVINFRLGV